MHEVFHLKVWCFVYFINWRFTRIWFLLCLSSLRPLLAFLATDWYYWIRLLLILGWSDLFPLWSGKEGTNHVLTQNYLFNLVRLWSISESLIHTFQCCSFGWHFRLLSHVHTFEKVIKSEDYHWTLVKESTVKVVAREALQNHK